jgi:hypothetical protein
VVAQIEGGPFADPGPGRSPIGGGLAPSGPDFGMAIQRQPSHINGLGGLGTIKGTFRPDFGQFERSSGGVDGRPGRPRGREGEGLAGRARDARPFG